MTWLEKLNAGLRSKRNIVMSQEDHFEWTYKKLLDLMEAKEMLSRTSFAVRLLDLAEDLKETSDLIDRYKIEIGELTFIKEEEDKR